MTQIDSIPPLLLGETSFFFDLDDILIGIKRPEWVVIPVDIKQALCKLSAAAGGAIALVSGKSIAELDLLSAPLHGPAAGVHGEERRDAKGKLHRITLPAALFAALGRELRQAIIAFDGCHMEDKGVAFSLHYRQGKQYKNQLIAIIR